MSKVEFYRIWFNQDLYKTFPVSEGDTGSEVCLLGAKKLNFEIQSESCPFQLYIVVKGKEKERYCMIGKQENVFRHLLDINEQGGEVDRLLFRIGVPSENFAMRSKTFQNWVEWILQLKEVKVKDMQKSWGDGLLLIHLASVLLRIQIDENAFHKKPKNGAQRLHNVNFALQYFRHKNTPLGDDYAQKIKKGHHETILATVWSIFVTHYGEIFGFKQVSEFLYLVELMIWLRQIRSQLAKNFLSPDSEQSTENFVSLFFDRLTLYSLTVLASSDPSVKEKAPLSSTAEGVDLLLTVGDSEAGIPKLLDVGGLLDAKCVDELSIVMYLSVLHHRTLNKERLIFSEMSHIPSSSSGHHLSLSSASSSPARISPHGKPFPRHSTKLEKEEVDLSSSSSLTRLPSGESSSTPRFFNTHRPRFSPAGKAGDKKSRRAQRKELDNLYNPSPVMFEKDKEKEKVSRSPVPSSIHSQSGPLPPSSFSTSPSFNSAGNFKGSRNVRRLSFRDTSNQPDGLSASVSSASASSSSSASPSEPQSSESSLLRPNSARVLKRVSSAPKYENTFIQLSLDDGKI